MNPWMIFLIGVLVGWLIEWVIDWVYWRGGRRVKTITKVEPLSSEELDSAREEISKLKSRLELCDEIRPHELERIKGVGPVIKRKLNKKRISTFAKLAVITPQELEGIVGEKIHRLVDAEAIIRQANELNDLI